MGKSPLIPAIKGWSMLFAQVERERIWRVERDVVIMRVGDVLLEQLCAARTSAFHFLVS